MTNKILSSHNEHKHVLPKYLCGLTEDDVATLLKSDKEIMKQFARWISEPSKVSALEQQITKLAQENLRLRTVQMAAYYEITDFWDKYTDTDGFGPQNLVRHLREGTGHYPDFAQEVINPKSVLQSLPTQPILPSKTFSNIAGLNSIEEVPQEDGGTTLVFDIDDDKINEFYANFGLKSGDTVGFEQVVNDAMHSLIEKYKAER